MTVALSRCRAPTVYAYVAPPGAVVRSRIEAAIAAKIRAAKASGASPEVMPSCAATRWSARRRCARRRGDHPRRRRRLPITVFPGGARRTMWARADDGRPLELRVDGAGPVKDARGLETVPWPAYEVVAGDGADRLLTIAGAHPDARVVRSAEAYAAAQRRLFPARVSAPRT